MKKQDLVTFLHDLLLPLLARQDLLIERQRCARFKLIKRSEQAADGLPCGCIGSSLNEFACRPPHTGQPLARRSASAPLAGFAVKQA